MRSQCPKYAMHAKEIGLHIMRSYHRFHLEPTKEKRGQTHRANSGRHHNKELKIKNNIFPNVSVTTFHDVHTTPHTHRN